ncbi:MAG: DUF2953 domain-containing protein [Oscillospiraceae bacterium]|nr:DUF2953 domain-containing protein [Oscillospiraceae bacterium]
MTALWIILGIIAFIALLMLLRAGVKAEIAEGGTTVDIKYGPFRFRIIPAKKGKKRKAGKNKEEEEKKPKKGASAGRVLEIVRLVSDALGRLRRKLTIDRLELSVVYGSEDAAGTAVAYGAASAVMGTIVPLIENSFKLKKRDFSITPVFDRKTLEVLLRAQVSAALGSLVWIGLVMFVKLMGSKSK